MKAFTTFFRMRRYESAGQVLLSMKTTLDLRFRAGVRRSLYSVPTVTTAAASSR